MIVNEEHFTFNKIFLLARKDDGKENVSQSRNNEKFL